MSRVWRVSLGVTFFLFLVYVASKYLVPEFMALLYKVLLVLIPFIISIVIALFLEPLVRLMVQRFKMSRTVAAGLTMLLVLGTVLAVFFLLIFRLGVELVELSVSLPQYTQSMQEFLANIVEQGKLYYFKYPDVVKQINENFGSIAKQLSDFISAMAQSLLHLATGVPGVVLGSIVALIATYFFIKDRHLIVAFWLRVVPEPWGRYVLTICNEAVGALFNYIRAQAVLVTLTMLQAIIGLHIIGIPYAVTVGILVGVVDIIPVLGPATVFVPWALWAFISGNIVLGIKLIVLYAFIWVVRQLLEAKVVAVNLGLHPLAVLAAMYLGFRLFGIIGLAVGPILIIVGLAVLRAIDQAKTKYQ